MVFDFTKHRVRGRRSNRMSSKRNAGWIEDACSLLDVCSKEDSFAHRALAELCTLVLRLDGDWPPQRGKGRTHLAWDAYMHLAACLGGASSSHVTTAAEHAYRAGEAIEKLRNIAAKEDEARTGRVNHEAFYQNAMRYMEKTGDRKLAYTLAKGDWVRANQAAALSCQSKIQLTSPSLAAWFKVLQRRQRKRAERFWSPALTGQHGKPSYSLFLRIARMQGLKEDAARQRARECAARLLLRYPQPEGADTIF